MAINLSLWALLYSTEFWSHLTGIQIQHQVHTYEAIYHILCFCVFHTFLIFDIVVEP